MKCLKCGHEWRERVDRPKRCPRCGKWLAVALSLVMVLAVGCARPRRYSWREVQEYDTAIKMAEKNGVDTGEMHQRLVDMLWSYLQQPGVDPQIKALQDAATAQQMQAVNGFIAAQPYVPPMTFGQWQRSR